MDREMPKPMTEESRIFDIYEEIEDLQTQLTSKTKSYFDSSFSQWRLSNTLETDDELYEAFVTRLKKEFIRVHSLACEANAIAAEMQRRVIYTVILQTPVVYLKPNERTVDRLCEPTIQVNHTCSTPQIWSVEKFEHRLNQMRNIHQRWKAASINSDSLKRYNPFYDKQPDSLIGVANIHLKALFFNSKLDYVVPIINIKGQTSGSLHVVLNHTGSSMMKHIRDLQIDSTVRGSMSEGICVDADEQSLSNHSASQQGSDDEGIEESSTVFDGKNNQITVKFAINEARDLPPSDAEHVICRYTFINPKLDQTAVSIRRSNEEKNEQKSHSFVFEHEMEYTFSVTDAFRSTCLSKSISVEVWSQYKPSLPSDETADADDNNQHLMKIRDLSRCWKDVKRHLQLIVEIHELNPSGQWKPVQVDAHDGILSGGIYRLKQGQSKHLRTELRVLPRSDAMPFSINAIRSVEIGSINTRKIDAPVQLDSYQDQDLHSLRQQWLTLIEKRKLLVESQLHALNQQADKTTGDIQKESILFNELLQLAEEQDVAVLPPQSSGIPGSPAGWNPPLDVEVHRPLIFLNVDPFKLTLSNDTAGLEATLSEEDPSKMVALPLVQSASDQVHAVALWDPTVHDSNAINRVTTNGTVVYLIVKITVLINKPMQMELVLRKRIAVTITKSEGWWPGKTLKNFLGYETYTRTSAIYEIVSNVPKCLYTTEEQTRLDLERVSRENIAQHILCASAIDSLLLLDRLRQDVLLAEKFAKQRTLSKATSAPDITSKKRKKNDRRSPATTRSKPFSDETNLLPTDSELHGSTPSISSRRSFIDDQKLSPIGPSPLPIRQPVVLDEDQQENVITGVILETKYLIAAGQSSESLAKLALDTKTEDHPVEPPVIVNTGHSIVQVPEITQYGDEIDKNEETWHGTEFQEPSGEFDLHSPTTVPEDPPPHEITPLRNESELDSSMPHIEEQQLQATGTTPFLPKQPVVFDDDQQENDNTKCTLDLEYPVLAAHSVESLSKLTPDTESDDYSVGSRVIVNTGNSIVQKPGIVRYKGKIGKKSGTWYGIELQEPLGKHHGTLDGRVYFECPDNHGVFVRCDKMQRAPS